MSTLTPSRLQSRRARWTSLPGLHIAARALTRHGLWSLWPRRPLPTPPSPPVVALSFDLDYQIDSDALPDLVQLLAREDATATLFSIGRLVASDPGPYRTAAAAGHEIGNHTHTHPDNPVLNPDQEFWHLSVDEMRAEIVAGQDAIEAATGARPTGFRTPHFKDAPRMMCALAATPEIDYVSTALASRCPVPVPYFPSVAHPVGELTLHYPARPGADASPLMIPLTPCPGMRWSPFCSYSAIRRPRDDARGAGLLDLEEWQRRWALMLSRARPWGFASVYFDPQDVMRDATTAATFGAMLTQARRAGWQLLPLQRVARTWRRHLLGEAAHD